MLRNDGTLAFVIPAEVIQVAYAQDLRLFLSTHFSSITLLTFEVLVFPEIEQEVLVFVGKRGTDDGKIREIESKT
jgi:adenine-specific DNA-methyltransferase